MREPNRTAKFGVAGFPPTFFDSSFKKKRANIFAWVNSLGLDWIELQNTYGVKMKEEQAKEYRSLAKTYDIGISLHAPYYITLASGHQEVVERSVERIFECFKLADTIGASRIIFHPGHFPGKSAEERTSGLKQLIHKLLEIRFDVPNDIFLYAETAGKKAQLGSVEEIVEICQRVPFVKPCLDIAHVHGFNCGSLTSPDSIIGVLEYVAKNLGIEALVDGHFHMYPVEIDSNGEKKHRAFHEKNDLKQCSLFGTEEDDSLFYPQPDHFISALKEKAIVPVVVCEALNSQEQGARLMKDLYLSED